MRFCLIVTTLWILISCSNNSPEGKDVFSYNVPEGIATLDPAFAKNQSIIWATHQIYNTLLETDSNLSIIPSLARSYSVSKDRLVYTFNLRRDVFFHDNEAFPQGRGRQMVADDVVYSFQRILDPKVASSGSWIFNNRVDTIQPFKAIDDSTFQLKLLKPFRPILGILTMNYCSIVPREVVEKYGKDFRSHPCGTGPFQFFLWQEGQGLVLHRNNNYFEKDEKGRQLPYLSAVKISFLDSKAAEFLAFRQNKLSFVNDIDPSFKDEILTINGELKKEWSNKIILQKHPFLNTEYLGIVVDSSLVKNSPLRMLKVRKAINYAIDRQKLVLYMRNSIGTPALSGFVPVGLPSGNTLFVRGYHYDPKKAKQLLQEAGFTNGKHLPQIVLHTIPTYADIGTFVARQLEDIGIKVKVDVLQKSVLLEQTAKSQALFFRGSWMADYPDAENYMAMFYSKNPAPPNYTRYKNRVFDKLYERSLGETNDSLRYQLYRQMDQIIIDDAPVIPLWYDMVIRLINEKVTGLNVNALNLLELRRVSFKQ